MKDCFHKNFGFGSVFFYFFKNLECDLINESLYFFLNLIISICKECLLWQFVMACKQLKRPFMPMSHLLLSCNKSFFIKMNSMPLTSKELEIVKNTPNELLCTVQSNTAKNCKFYILIWKLKWVIRYYINQIRYIWLIFCIKFSVSDFPIQYGIRWKWRISIDVSDTLHIYQKRKKINIKNI